MGNKYVLLCYRRIMALGQIQAQAARWCDVLPFTLFTNRWAVWYASFRIAGGSSIE